MASFFRALFWCGALLVTACGDSSRANVAKGHPAADKQNRQTEHVVFNDDEQTLFESLNRARRQAGLRAVVWADNLASVARSYSREMAKTGIIAHESNLSGSLTDRLKTAGMTLPGVSENLAKAGTAKEAHRGLMNSPGHRANILDPMAAEVGIGVAAIDEEEKRALIVTQIFALKPKPIDQLPSGDDLIAIANRARKEAGLPPLHKHPWLTRAAQEASARYVPGEALEISDFSLEFKLVKSIVLKSIDPIKSIQNAQPLIASQETHIGIGLAICHDENTVGDTVCVVVLLGLTAAARVY